MEMSGMTILDAARSSLGGFVLSEAPQVKSLTDQRGTETHSYSQEAFEQVYADLFRIVSATKIEDPPRTIYHMHRL
jgi:hypothetical protein